MFHNKHRAKRLPPFDLVELRWDPLPASGERGAAMGWALRFPVGDGRQLVVERYAAWDDKRSALKQAARWAIENHRDAGRPTVLKICDKKGAYIDERSYGCDSPRRRS